jgi:phage FluMu protein gp41
MVQIEHDFLLPVGLLGDDDALHRSGTMRMATAADEILPMQDPRVTRNPAYLTVILLSRVIVRLDGVEPVTPRTIESLFAADLAYLQHLFNRINDVEAGDAAGPSQRCPSCGEAVDPGHDRLGESVATRSGS